LSIPVAQLGLVSWGAELVRTALCAESWRKKVSLRRTESGFLIVDICDATWGGGVASWGAELVRTANRAERWRKEVSLRRAGSGVLIVDIRGATRAGELGRRAGPHSAPRGELAQKGFFATHRKRYLDCRYPWRNSGWRVGAQSWSAQRAARRGGAKRFLCDVPKAVS